MAHEGGAAELRLVLSELKEALARIAEGGNRNLSIAAAPQEAAAVPPVSREERSPVVSVPRDERSELPAPGGDAAAGAQQRPSRLGPATGDPNGMAVEPGSANWLPPQIGTGRPVSDYATLEALQYAYRDCMACKLGKTRNRLVFGAGAGRPRLMFIGEGPGAEEDAQGLPFVGRAGKLLTGFITALGLTRADVYITNVVKCRPPGNRVPEPDEVSSCRPILMRQIELLDPKLIVTLGNVPLKALNPKAGGITRERGKPFAFLRWTVFPTFHPSYLFRSPRDIQTCWRDLRLAFRDAYPPA